MKTIKYIISAIILLGAVNMNAQQKIWFIYQGIEYYIRPIYNTFTTVNTPNNSVVYVRTLQGGDWTLTDKTAMVGYYQAQYGGRLTLESEATAMYNCHAWAWAGSTAFIMDYYQAETYFASYDLSYVSTTNTAVATKVWFGSGGHSANTTSTPGYLSSKWEEGPRFKHLVADCPYSTTNLTYYVRPAIDGPGTVQYVATQYNLTNASGLGTIYWTLSGSGSSLLQLNSSSGNPTTVTRFGMTTGGGYATLEARINSTSGKVVASKNISPVSLQISGPSYVFCGDYVNYSIPYIPGASYSWSSDNGYLIDFGGGYSNNFYVSGYIPGGWAQDYLRCTITYGGVNYYYYTIVYIECD